MQGEVLQERLQRLHLATIAELFMSVCQSVLQETSDNSRVAVVSNVLLQLIIACSTTLRSIVNTNIREEWIRDTCRACMYLSATQQKSVAHCFQETIQMATKQTFFVPIRRLVHARSDWEAMNRTLVDDIASRTYRAYVPVTDSQMPDHCTPPIHHQSDGSEDDENYACNEAGTSARTKGNVPPRINKRCNGVR